MREPSELRASDRVAISCTQIGWPASRQAFSIAALFAALACGDVSSTRAYPPDPQGLICHVSRSRSPRLACILLLTLAACGEPPASSGVTAARDSAGVTITEPSPPYPALSLSPTPVLRIGVVNGDPEYQLSRVAYAARLSDGGVVLIDGASAEVRWYGADGTFRARAGGRGEGPGDLLWVVGATLTPEDTLVLYDARNQRLSWFGPDGTLARTHRLALASDMELHALRAGRLLLTEERHTLNIGGRQYNPARDTMRVLLTSSAAETVDTVMQLPGQEAATWVDYVDGTPTATRQFGVPYGQVTLVGGAGDRIAVVYSGRHDLALLDESGTLRRLTRRQDVNPPGVTASLRREYVTSAVDQAEERGMAAGPAEEGAEELIDLLPEGRTVPAFDRLLSAAVDEQIWLRDFLPEWRSQQARRWTIHDLSGKVVGQVTTPADLELIHVGRGYLVGLERDGMGVEHVAVYSLDRS